MLNKVISVIVAAAVFMYLGCRDTVQLTRDQLVLDRNNNELRVLTRDHKQYRFGEGVYYIVGDSLKGSGVQVISPSHLIPFYGSIAVSDIDLAEKEELNGGKTVLCVLGVSLAVALVATAIAAAAFTNAVNSTAQHSCPFVYTYDGRIYHFESETFSGAVLKGLERIGYDNLRYLKPVDGTYHLKLANEQRETEYVNELKLIVVDHPQSTRIIPDVKGVIHTISCQQAPLRCTDFSNHDVLKYVSSKDSVYWESDLSAMDFGKDSDLRDGIIMEFAKPEHAKVAKLVVNGRNTGLGEFALTKVFQLKGDDKLLWYQELEQNPTERTKFLAWMMREGMLHVKVWQDGTWREQKSFVDVGPLIARDQVALLDVGNVQGIVLKVKLECTTDLWRIDEVSVDYSTDMPVTMTELSPQSALDEQGKDIAGLLSASDDQYYVTLQGQHADVTFKDIPQRGGTERSYVLKSRGFYYQWIDAGGPGNVALLERVLTEPGFAAKQYLPEWKKASAEYGSRGN